jgi:hypothetical protein
LAELDGILKRFTAGPTSHLMKTGKKKTKKILGHAEDFC